MTTKCGCDERLKCWMATPSAVDEDADRCQRGITRALGVAQKLSDQARHAELLNSSAWYAFSLQGGRCRRRHGSSNPMAKDNPHILHTLACFLRRLARQGAHDVLLRSMDDLNLDEAE